MNEKVQAILLKLVLDMKKHRWVPLKDWEITVKSEGHVPLAKTINVDANMDSKSWQQVVDVSIDLKLVTEDEITYFPEYVVYANIFIEGGNSKDLSYKMDVDAAFTESDFNNTSKIETASNKINRHIQDQIEKEFEEYINSNYEAITSYRLGGYKEDDDD